MTSAQTLFIGEQASNRIQRRIKQDFYGNDVSIITLIDGRRLNMVHHKPRSRYRQHATIYAARGKSVTWRAYTPSNECVETTASIADYEMTWGDGDITSTLSPPNAPDLKDVLRHIVDDDFDGFIVTVLTAIIDTDHLWTYKEPRAAAA
jgi:hypothetical protein